MNDRILIEGIEDWHHIKNVYRLRIGERLECKGRDYVYEVELKRKKRDYLDFEILSRRRIRITGLKVRLCQGLTKKKAFDFILQKATELGVYEIIPYRGVYGFMGDIEKKKVRWEKIVIEASKQSNRDIVPKVLDDIQDLNELEGFIGGKLIANEKEKRLSLKEGIFEMRGYKDFMICVGAEGGFTEVELKKALDMGFLSCSLGERILRSETAALMMVSNLFFALDG